MSANEPPPIMPPVRRGRGIGGGRCDCDCCDAGAATWVAVYDLAPGLRIALCLACLAKGIVALDEMEQTTGLEPATSGLGNRRSTNRAASADDLCTCGHTRQLHGAFLSLCIDTVGSAPSQCPCEKFERK